MPFGQLNGKLAGVAFAALLGAFAIGANAPVSLAASTSNFSAHTPSGGTVTQATETTKVAGKKKRKKFRRN